MKSCENVNECEGVNECAMSTGAICTDSSPGYSCSCPAGHLGTGYKDDHCIEQLACSAANEEFSICGNAACYHSCVSLQRRVRIDQFSNLILDFDDENIKINSILKFDQNLFGNKTMILKLFKNFLILLSESQLFFFKMQSFADVKPEPDIF